MRSEIDIMGELEEVRELFKAEEFRAALKALDNVWEKIPDPKSDTVNAYMIIEYGVVLSFKLGDLDEAQKWASQAPPFAEKRHDMGEVEFLVGKVAFEKGELVSAKENFLSAHKKSRGRIFEGADPKYKALLKEKK